ncbi:MAG: class I SAM-dependent methyltransferase [Novosphingobium sp.]|uniref:class I SAM-dependent methyltransferase n=1 Tax=Novosphingobium sp. TaxID=1874826 RepID=UPI003C7E228E
MAIGATVRRAFGKHERKVSELWRAIFVDLDAWTAAVREWAPGATRILELGCGEGYSTERLAAAFPEAQIDAVDIADNIGRLYQGPRDKVQFRQIFAEELAAQQPGSYDLIILADVIHHVPKAARQSLLKAVRTLLAPGGVLLFKDWARNHTPIYYFGYASDRWLTGDRIEYLTPGEASEMLRSIFGPASLVSGKRIRPWQNNYAFMVQAA